MRFFPGQHVLAWESISFKAILATVTVFDKYALNEMDYHADTCCLGKNFIPLYYTGKVCNVHAYSDIEVKVYLHLNIG